MTTHFADDKTLAELMRLERELAEAQERIKFLEDGHTKTSVHLIRAGIPAFGWNHEGVDKLAAKRDELAAYAEGLKTALERVRFQAFAYRPDERQMRKILDIADDALDAKGPEGGL